MAKFKRFTMLNEALEASDGAFKTLYFILNQFWLENTTRGSILRAEVAESFGLLDDTVVEDRAEQRKIDRKNLKQQDKISRFTEELVERDLLKKDVIFDKTTGKRKTFYAIPERFLVEKVNTGAKNLGENVPKNGVSNKEESIKEDEKAAKADKKAAKTLTELCESAAEDEKPYSSGRFVGATTIDLDNLPF